MRPSRIVLWKLMTCVSNHLFFSLSSTGEKAKLYCWKKQAMAQFHPQPPPILIILVAEQQEKSAGQRRGRGALWKINIRECEQLNTYLSLSCVQICPVLSLGVLINTVWIKENANSRKQVLPGGTVDTLCAPIQKGCSAVCEIRTLDKLPSCLRVLILAPAFISRCSGLCAQMKLALNILITYQILAASIVWVVLGVVRKGNREWKYTKKVVRKLKKQPQTKQGKQNQVLVQKTKVSQTS